MNAARSPWRAEAWVGHARRCVIEDDPGSPTGVHLVAECDTERTAALVAAAPVLLRALRTAIDDLEENHGARASHVSRENQVNGASQPE